MAMAAENKEYQPPFIVRVKGINLIVECEDFDGDKSGNKEAYGFSPVSDSAVCLKSPTMASSMGLVFSTIIAA